MTQSKEAKNKALVLKDFSHFANTVAAGCRARRQADCRRSALAAYERALEPKRLALIPGGHFDPYLDQFPLAAVAATEWFREHLLNPDVNHS